MIICCDFLRVYFWLLDVFSGQFGVVLSFVFKTPFPVLRAVALVLDLVDRLSALDALLEAALPFSPSLTAFDAKFLKHALH